MTFEVFARRLDDKLRAVDEEAAGFNGRWRDLRETLIEPILKTAENGFKERAFRKVVCQTHGGAVSLWVTRYGLESRISFSADAERLQVACAVASYPEGHEAEAQEDRRFFALAEMPQLVVEKLVLEFAETVARGK